MDLGMKYRLVRPARVGVAGLGAECSEEALRGLRVLMGGPEDEKGVVRGSGVEGKLRNFLDYAAYARVDVHRQVLAVENVAAGRGGRGEGVGRVVATCLWVPSAGRTAMLFGPNMSDFPEAAGGLQAAAMGAMEDAKGEGVVLVQAMVEPADAAGKTVFAAAGMTQLATLVYMERKPPARAPEYELPAGYSLESYSAGTHGVFREVIGRTYEQTLDCPGLTGLRELEDVMEGHKAVGPFDPQLWSVVMEGSGEGRRAVGCVLLSEITARRALELVYLGLVPEARGRGLARALLLRTLGIATRRGFEVATLAVDAGNLPAIRLYRRCGYTSTANRVAMIKKLG